MKPYDDSRDLDIVGWITALVIPAIVLSVVLFPYGWQ